MGLDRSLLILTITANGLTSTLASLLARVFFSKISTITANGLASTLASLLARFFFSKSLRITANGLTSTLARVIAEGVPSLGPIIVEAVEKHPNFVAGSLQRQLESLAFTPLKSLKERYILVIDALDECSKADRGVLLKSTLDFIAGFDAGSCPLKVLLAGRPEDDIVSRIRKPRYVKLIHAVSFSLHSKENKSNEDDIQTYHMRVLSNYLTRAFAVCGSDFDVCFDQQKRF
jgi:hypothetical protein